MPAALASITSKPASANSGRSSRSFPALRVPSNKVRLLAERTPLRRVDLANALRREFQQTIELGSRERPMLAGALHLDEASVAAHDDVHVDVGRDVFGIVEIQP